LEGFEGEGVDRAEGAGSLQGAPGGAGGGPGQEAGGEGVGVGALQVDLGELPAVVAGADGDDQGTAVLPGRLVRPPAGAVAEGTGSGPGQGPDAGEAGQGRSDG